MCTCPGLAGLDASADSLSDLERLIEEQHKDLVARGMLPSDDKHRSATEDLEIEELIRGMGLVEAPHRSRQESPGESFVDLRVSEGRLRSPRPRCFLADAWIYLCRPNRHFFTPSPLFLALLPPSLLPAPSIH